ncbi:hypothetical protein MY1884_002992 [Beauveria asiatica]
MVHYGRLDSGVPDPDGRGYLGTLNVYHDDKRGEEEPVYRRSNDNAATA